MLTCEHKLVGEDIGIGSYEYCGAMGVDSRIEIRCHKCDMVCSADNADLLDGNSGVFEAEDGEVYEFTVEDGVRKLNGDDAPDAVCAEVYERLKGKGA